VVREHVGLNYNLAPTYLQHFALKLLRCIVLCVEWIEALNFLAIEEDLQGFAPGNVADKISMIDERNLVSGMHNSIVEILFLDYPVV